jgi:hypothetical protein
MAMDISHPQIYKKEWILIGVGIGTAPDRQDNKMGRTTVDPIHAVCCPRAEVLKFCPEGMFLSSFHCQY